MNIIKDIEQMRAFVNDAKAAGRIVGLVPTLGGLHEGHFSLIDRARRECDVVVVSIFLNPTQFGPGEDLTSYPCSPDADHAGCQAHGVHAVFAPDVATMYGQGGLTEVMVSRLSDTLCGRSRPTHFAGVCTVVAKLFNIIPAHRAYFGAKDYQQAAIIKQMVADLNFPIEIVLCPTVREPDGLAMSSRNANLSAAEREQAPALHAALLLAADTIRKTRPPADEVIAAIVAHLSARAPDGQIDYVQIVDPATLADVEQTGRPVLVALAVKFGAARLIDNILVDGPSARP
jgi:pantoate--beta-alanine ligase